MISLQVDPDVTGTLTAVIVALGVLLVALLGIATKVLSYARLGARESAMANSAVNNIGTGDRLYDRIEHLHEALSVLIEAQRDFQAKGWANLPADIGDATAMTITIRQLQAAIDSDKKAHKEIRAELATLMAFLKAHDEWERTQKFPAN